MISDDRALKRFTHLEQIPNAFSVWRLLPQASPNSILLPPMAGDYVCDDVPFIVLVDSNHVSSNEANFCHFLGRKSLCLQNSIFDILRAVFSSRLSWNFLGSLGKVQRLRVIENRKAVWLFLKFISKFISIRYNSEALHCELAL